jgi:RHS repeat-associated protein
MTMPGRSYSAGSGYRYGFNGKENDNEVKGEGNQQDYGMRIYDLRLGRFLTVDPLIRKYPELTPYQFASNSPVSGIDIDGLEYYFASDGSYLGQSKKGGTQIRIAHSYKILKDGTYAISNWQELKQHSASDTYKGRDEAGNTLTGLTHVSNKDFGRMSAYMNVVLEKEGRGLYQAEEAVLKQSVGIKKGSGMSKLLGDNNNYGLLDFKHSAFSILGLGTESNSLIEYNGTVYNPNEFGNLVWGAGIAALGVTIDPVALAEVGTKAAKGLTATDEPHDRNAIIQGVQIGTAVRAAVLGNKKALKDKDAVEIMNGANQSYNNGQATKDYEHEKEVQRNNIP